jgi:DNA-binding ferritin-like protein (Dps family)
MKNLLNAILISLLFISCQSNSEKNSEILKFIITDKQDISYINNPRMVYRIVLDVDSLPTYKEMRNTAIYIWENGNKNWKEFTAFLYLPEMNTGLTAYGIGEFNEDGLIKFEKNENALFGTKWEIKEMKEAVKKIPVAELKEYTIELFAINEGERKVKININTDFPDGVNFLVSIDRTHYLKGKNEAYSGKIFSKDLTVKNGEIETIVNINDTKWYNEHQELVKALPDDFSPISKISDKIDIDVLFSPRRNQSADILIILGSNGEFVKGDGAEKSGNLTTYRISKELNIPFKK